MSAEQRVTDEQLVAAIAAVHESRQTHVLWVEWYQIRMACQSGTCDHAVLDTTLVGDSAFHHACIDRYDGVIATLQAAGTDLRASRAREARLMAITYASDDGTEHAHTHRRGEGEPECPACWVHGIRAALVKD